MYIRRIEDIEWIFRIVKKLNKLISCVCVVPCTHQKMYTNSIKVNKWDDAGSVANYENNVEKEIEKKNRQKGIAKEHVGPDVQTQTTANKCYYRIFLVIFLKLGMCVVILCVLKCQRLCKI